MSLVRLASAWLVGVALATWLGPPTGAAAVRAVGCLAVGAALVAFDAPAVIARAARRSSPPGGTVPTSFRTPRPARRSAALVLVAALGVLRQTAATPSIDPGHIADYNDHGTVTVRGRIVAEPRVRDRGTEYRVAVDGVLDAGDMRRGAVGAGHVAVEGVGGGVDGVLGAGERARSAVEGVPAATTGTGADVTGDWADAHGLVLVQTARFPARAYGDSVVVTATLQTPPVLESFDYRAWLARQGIHSLARRARVETVARGGGNPVRRALLGVKDRARRALAAALPEPEAALATGILLGDDEGIPESVAEAFKTTNTSHVIAISGSNIALLVALLSASIGRLLGRRAAVPVILVVLVLYCALVGADAAVVRAAAMGSIAVVGILLHRPSDARTVLLAAAWAMTAYRPGYVLDLGFQLSFAATLGLVVFSDPLAAGAERLAAHLFGAERGHRMRAVLGDAVIVTLAAQVTTWPIIAAQVGTLSLVGLVANFLVVPAQPAVMLLGGLAAIGGMLSPAVGQIAGVVAWLPLAYTIRVVELTATAPMASVAWSMPTGLVVCYYAVLALVAHPRRVALAAAVASAWQRFRLARSDLGSARDRIAAVAAGLGSARRQLTGIPAGLAPAREWTCGLAPRLVDGWAPIALLGVACALVWTAALGAPDGRLHLYVLDVGQGDALLLVTPHGNRMLVDGGPGPSATLDGLGRHLPPWDRRLDVVVLTHPDVDHVGGLAAVLERYQVSVVVVPPIEGVAPEARAFRASVGAERAAVVDGAAGLRLVLDEAGGVDAVTLWPPANAETSGASGTNNASVVLRVAHGGVTLLLPGDIEAPAEQALIASGAPLDADVLKLAHHGSDTSSIPELVAAVTPSLALVSVGQGNGFGHPSPDVIARLAGAVVRRTDQDGEIEVVSDGRDVWVRGASRASPVDAGGLAER